MQESGGKLMKDQVIDSDVTTGRDLGPLVEVPRIPS